MQNAKTSTCVTEKSSQKCDKYTEILQVGSQYYIDAILGIWPICFRGLVWILDSLGVTFNLFKGHNSW